MGTTSSIPSSTHIVIVGAGYAGNHLALELLKFGANFTIISRQDYFHHNNASVRAIVEPGIANKTLIPLRETFKEHFKLGEVTEIRAEDKVLVLKSGESVKYDILVIATGSLGPSPYKLNGETREEALKLYDDMLKKIKSSQRIAIIGGGPTGVEVAGEIATDYPDKTVTLIHSGQELVSPGLSSSFKKKLDGVLKNLKLNVILGEKVSNLDEFGESGPFLLKTNAGTEIEVDLYLKSTGLWINDSAYRTSLGEAVNERGQLKVNEYFKVDGCTDIYAIGDCCDAPEPKIAFLAIEHGKLLAANIKKVLLDKTPTAYKPDKAPTAAVISVGRHRGLGQLRSGILVPEFLMVKLKSKNMMIGDFWKDMKQPVPK